MRKNILNEEKFIGFLQKNVCPKETDEISRKDKLNISNPKLFINNFSSFNPIRVLEVDKKVKLKEKILASMNIENYFCENVKNDFSKNYRNTIELKLDRIEKILGFQIFKLIHDLYEFTKINLQIPETDKKTNIIDKTAKNCYQLPKLNYFDKKTEKPSNNCNISTNNYFINEKNDIFFKSLHEKTIKAENKQFLDEIYTKSISVFLTIQQLSKNIRTPIKKKTKKGVLRKLNSLTVSPSKYNDEDKYISCTPETDKQRKKVSFHEEVTIQIFCPFIKECITTVKKQDFKEKRKKAVNFLQFKQKQETSCDLKMNEGSKNLLKFINGNNLGIMENFNYLQNNYELNKDGEKNENYSEMTNNGQKIVNLNIKENSNNNQNNKETQKPNNYQGPKSDFQKFGPLKRRISFEEFLNKTPEEEAAF